MPQSPMRSFNSLFEIHYVPAGARWVIPKGISFNSLFEILELAEAIEKYLTDDEWKAISFNSLFEIPGEWWWRSSSAITSTFNSLFEIHKAAWSMNFPTEITFNSLFEILQNWGGEDDRAGWKLSILFLRFTIYLRVKEEVGDALTFNSLFEIQRAPPHYDARSCSFHALSILFLRFSKPST